LVSIYILNKSGGVWFANQLDSDLKAVEQPLAQYPDNSYYGDVIVK